MEQEKLQEELEQFKKHLVLHHSLREITIKNHIGNIKRMLSQIETLNPEKEEVIEFVYRMKQGNTSISNISNNISSVEKYMDFKRKLVRFARPRRQKSLIVDVLTEAEVSRMFYFCKNIKEKAILAVLVFSGIRNKSFCDLKLKDIDLGNKTLLIRKPKGRKEYYALIDSEAVKILVNYLERYPRRAEDYLFTTKVNNNQYSPSDIRKFIKVLAKRAEILKRVWVHLLRHSLATNMRNRGAELDLIKEVLGHDDINSTMIYSQPSPQRTKSEYERFKPVYL